MEFTVKAAAGWEKCATDCLVIPVHESGKKLDDELDIADRITGGLISKLSRNGELPSASGSSLLLFNTHSETIPRVLLVGCGKQLSLSSFRELVKSIRKELGRATIASANLLFHRIAVDKISSATLLQQAVTLIETEGYQYDTTLSKKAKKAKLTRITFHCSEKKGEKGSSALAVARGQAIANGMNQARQLGNLPPNICTPTFLAQEASALAKGIRKMKCRVLNEAEMKKLGMNALLSVSAGSQEPAKLIILEYKGGKPTDRPVVLVGKGITFDSGGISLKPGPKMDEMKYDMCGAASVIGALHAAAELNLPLNIIGAIPAVENMPGGTATRPGDIITSMSGQTIEILNTDAEGRLILCDTLTYVERFNPAVVIDIATLTGACVVALGSHASGLYSNRRELSAALQAAGDETHDRAWPMPLWEDFDKQLATPFADMANIGGPEGGSVTAACFLARYTKKYPWAHLDIAGAAWRSAGPKGATGRPVALLVQYLAGLNGKPNPT